MFAERFFAPSRAGGPSNCHDRGAHRRTNCIPYDETGDERCAGARRENLCEVCLPVCVEVQRLLARKSMLVDHRLPLLYRDLMAVATAEMVHRINTEVVPDVNVMVADTLLNNMTNVMTDSVTHALTKSLGKLKMDLQ